MNILKKLRAEKNVYQKDVANYLGIDRTTYVKYENGTSEPNNAMLIKLADYFDVSLDYLLGREPRRPETIASSNNFNITEEEKQLLIAYREHTELQTGIKKMLDVKSDDTSTLKKSAAPMQTEFDI